MRLPAFCLVLSCASGAAMDVVVTPAWVASQRKAVPPMVVLEASWATLKDAKEYHSGHVPGAVHVNTDDFENGYPRWHLRPVAELHDVIGKLGITPQTTVVVYSAKTIAAARVWWILMYAGVRDVRVMNGGYQAWLAAGLPGETAVVLPRAATFRAPPRSNWLATTAHVKERYREAALVDVRSRDEYLGAVSGYSYLAAKGRIPGAIHAGNADDSARIYQTRDGTLRDSREVLDLWRPHALTPERETIFYCGGGWRSSLAFLHAWALGFRNVRNYSDGWSGWSTRYQQEAGYGGITPGWRQSASGNPFEIGSAR